MKLKQKQTCRWPAVSLTHTVKISPFFLINRGRRKVNLVLLSIYWTLGGVGGGRDGGVPWMLPVDVEEETLKIVSFCLEKTIHWEVWETSKFHDDMSFFTLFNCFGRCSYSWGDRVVQKVAKQVPWNASNLHCIWCKKKRRKHWWTLREREREMRERERERWERERERGEREREREREKRERERERECVGGGGGEVGDWGEG